MYGRVADELRARNAGIDGHSLAAHSTAQRASAHTLLHSVPLAELVDAN